MVSPKYVTRMIPFWQKVWILLKQLLPLLFWKTCLLQVNLSRPQALSQAKPALLWSHLSIRALSSSSFHCSLFRFRKSFLVAGAAFLPGLLGSGFILILVTHFPEEAGEHQKSFSFFPCNASAIRPVIELFWVFFFLFF